MGPEQPSEFGCLSVLMLNLIGRKPRGRINRTAVTLLVPSLYIENHSTAARVLVSIIIPSGKGSEFLTDCLVDEGGAP